MPRERPVGWRRLPRSPAAAQRKHGLGQIYIDTANLGRGLPLESFGHTSIIEHPALDKTVRVIR